MNAAENGGNLLAKVAMPDQVSYIRETASCP